MFKPIDHCIVSYQTATAYRKKFIEGIIRINNKEYSKMPEKEILILTYWYSRYTTPIHWSRLVYILFFINKLLKPF